MCFGQQGVHCWPVDPFPNALPNLQGGSHFLALLPKVEWYLHKPGIFDHGLGPVWTWPRWLCCGGPREAPVAFTCTSCVSLVTSVIRSASDANSLMSVLEDVARIRRTSGGSWARKSALNSVFGSAFKFFMCCRSSDGFLLPKPFRFNNSWSFSACVLPKVLISAAFIASYGFSGGSRMMF